MERRGISPSCDWEIFPITWKLRFPLMVGGEGGSSGGGEGGVKCNEHPSTTSIIWCVVDTKNAANLIPFFAVHFKGQSYEI